MFVINKSRWGQKIIFPLKNCNISWCHCAQQQILQKTSGNMKYRRARSHGLDNPGRQRVYFGGVLAVFVKSIPSILCSHVPPLPCFPIDVVTFIDGITYRAQPEAKLRMEDGMCRIEFSLTLQVSLEIVQKSARLLW